MLSGVPNVFQLAMLQCIRCESIDKNCIFFWCLMNVCVCVCVLWVEGGVRVSFALCTHREHWELSAETHFYRNKIKREKENTQRRESIDSKTHNKPLGSRSYFQASSGQLERPFSSALRAQIVTGKQKLNWFFIQLNVQMSEWSHLTHCSIVRCPGHFPWSQSSHFLPFRYLPWADGTSHCLLMMMMMMLMRCALHLTPIALGLLPLSCWRLSRLNGWLNYKIKYQMSELHF